MNSINQHTEVLSFLNLQVRSLLDLEEHNIDPYLNLFELGLHSLAIVQLVSRIRSEYGIQIQIKDLFVAVCLYEMASLIATRLTRPQ